MKLEQYFLLVLIVLSKSGLSQVKKVSMKAQYECIYQVNKPNGFHQAESEKFILLIGETYTLFLGETKMKYDSVRKTTSNIELLMSVTPSGVSGGSLSKEEVLISRITNNITVLDKPALKKTLYYTENVKHNWVITNEKEIINGWECKKATVNYKGRNYEVWFTKEIPLPVGPYKFFGLPGLIVKVQDTDCLFYFELIDIRKPNYSKNLDFTTDGALESSSSGIQQAYTDFLANPQFAMEAAGITMTGLDGSNMMDKFKPKDPPVFIEILD